MMDTSYSTQQESDITSDSSQKITCIVCIYIYIYKKRKREDYCLFTLHVNKSQDNRQIQKHLEEER